MKKKTLVLLCEFAVLCVFPRIALAADQGHRHDELNEQQLGTVHFPTSCAPGVQKNFERGRTEAQDCEFD